ncbi:MAG: malate synthase A [Acidobacteriota bacterium]
MQLRSGGFLMAAVAISEDKAVWRDLAPGVRIPAAAWDTTTEKVLSGEAIEVVAALHRALETERQTLLAHRETRQAAWDTGQLPTYCDNGHPATHSNGWKVAPIPADLTRRRVEITGPVNNTKMVINMLSRNADGDRADTAMLDFEDSMKPSWRNVIDGVVNVIGIANGDLTFVKKGKGDQADTVYEINTTDMAHPMVRVRGLHLDEANLEIDGTPVAGGLLDLALVLFHTGKRFVEQSTTPTFYVPKVEHYLEARWWNQLFTLAQKAVGLEVGTLRATFLIETLPAAFQMEEILWEIREHAAGLNVGRWDKIFSDIKVLKAHPDRVMADRASIGLNRPWMRNYARRLINVCHRRGAFAIGGMAAFTPGRTPERRAEQTAKVREDKELEASLGHDGCWVSHPYFIGVALAAFTQDNQIDVIDESLGEYPDLLPHATPPHTLAGLRTNVRVGIAYLRGWNADIGCVAWDDLMEDLATLEISRAQTWQWLHNAVTVSDGDDSIVVDKTLLRRVFQEELERILDETGATGEDRASWLRAADDAESVFVQDDFAPFLTRTSELVG